MLAPPIHNVIKLHWWKDFWRFQPEVFRAIRKAPFLSLILLAFYILGSVTDSFDRILNFADGFCLIALCIVVVGEVWSRITGQVRLETPNDHKNWHTVWGNAIIYQLSVVIGVLLLIGPGVYLLIAGSLGIVFICIEQLNAWQAFQASIDLVRGYFWKILGYLIGAPLIMLVIFGGTEILLEFIGFYFNENFDKTIWSDALIGIACLGFTWTILSTIALQVCAYAYLKQEKNQINVT